MLSKFFIKTVLLESETRGFHKLLLGLSESVLRGVTSRRSFANFKIIVTKLDNIYDSVIGVTK